MPYIQFNNTGAIISTTEYTTSLDEIEITQEQRALVDENRNKFMVKDALLVDISQTPDYLARKLEEAKEAKLAENKQKRDARLIGGVDYEGVLFDSDTDSKINISIQLSEMNDTDTVVWKGMNNDRVLFTKQDFVNLAGLLKKLTVDIWGDGGLDDQYTKAISDAQTLSKLEEIEIDYSKI